MSEVRTFSESDIAAQLKPLSRNSFLAFFQNLWRGWLSVWYSFSDKHPKAAKLIYQIVMFLIFSNGVTIVQYLLFLFLPHLFGIELAGVEWLWPGIKLFEKDGQVFKFALLGKPIVRDDLGNAIIGGGLGYFYAFLIATFIAQCINFPLQRNITFKSHGNPWWQAMWYLIGWMLIQPFCDGLASLYKPAINGMFGFTLPVALQTLIDTVFMGGVSMVIFFFVFLIIFPDYEAMEKRAKAKVERLQAKGASPEAIKKAEEQLKVISMKAKLSNTEKVQSKAITQANAKALTYFAVVKNNKSLVANGQPAKLAKEKAAFDDAVRAIIAKEEAIKSFQQAKKEAATAVVE